MAGHGSSTRTSDVLLRDVAERDLPVLFEHRRAPAANRMSGFPPKDWDAFVAHWSAVMVEEGVTKRTVLVDGHVAGNVVSFEQDGEREVGYWIGGEFWGKGVATEALSRFLSHAEVRRPLHARVAEHNAGSVRVLEKCGFALVGQEEGEYVLRLPAG